MVKAAATELDWRAGSPALLLAQLGLENLPAGQAALLDKKPRERWLVAVWLSALADELVYPLRVHSSERPDFLIQGPGQSIGVECMEVVPEELKRLQHELREVNSGWVRPLLAPGEHDWDWSNPLLQRLVAPRAIPATVGQEDPAALWLAVMDWAVAKKREVMARPGFQRQRRNVLLLHDNWPLPAMPCIPCGGADAGPGQVWLDTVHALQTRLLRDGAHAQWQQVAIVQGDWLWLLEAGGVRVLPRR